MNIICFMKYGELYNFLIEWFGYVCPLSISFTRTKKYIYISICSCGYSLYSYKSNLYSAVFLSTKRRLKKNSIYLHFCFVTFKKSCKIPIIDKYVTENSYIWCRHY